MPAPNPIPDSNSVPDPTPGTGPFRRLADLCARRRLLVLSAWVVLLVGLWVVASLAPPTTSEAYSIPGAASQRASDLLGEHGLSDDAGDEITVVVHSPSGIEARRAAVDGLTADVQDAYPGARITPISAPGQVSDDGTTGRITVRLQDTDGGELSPDDLAGVPERLTPLRPDGLQTEFLGGPFSQAAGGGSEVLGVAAAVVILLLAFGSVLAMAVPIVVALFGAGCGVAALVLAGHVIGMSSAATPLAAMLALGVGIDYSLLVVTRYRELLAAGDAPRAAVLHAHDTAGRSVLFAGATVVVAVAGLVFMQMPLVTGIAVGAALAVAVTMAAALTLLPATLAIIGPRIDRLHVGRRRPPGAQTWSALWARVVQRRPWAFAVGGLVVLLALSAPAATMRLGFGDAGSLPTSTTARKAHDLLAESFGPGAAGPLFIVVDARDAGTAARDAALAEAGRRLAGEPGVAAVTPPVTSPDGAIGLLIAQPTTAPDDAATADLVTAVRADLDGLPPGTSAEVTGVTAAAIDFSAYSNARLPVFIGIVMLIAFLVLAVVFRSLLIPLKAVIVNLLSIGAALGVVVAALQWGWGLAIFGADHALPVTAWVPMMVVAVVFGLSMDYEVFLLSRIKEEHDQGLPNGAAVASGIAHTARVITAAAAIMVCVFLTLVFGTAVDLAVFGFALAVAVFIDATLVRMVLVPAVMELLGEANWWLPGRGAGPARRTPGETSHRSVSI